MKLIVTLVAALAAAGGGYALYGANVADLCGSCCDAKPTATVSVVEAGLAADMTECEKVCTEKTDCLPADCDPTDCDPADCTDETLAAGEYAMIDGDLLASPAGAAECNMAKTECTEAEKAECAEAKVECTEAVKVECSQAKKSCSSKTNLD